MPFQTGVFVQQSAEAPIPLVRPGQGELRFPQSRLQPREPHAFLQEVQDRNGLQLHEVLGQVPYLQPPGTLDAPPVRLYFPHQDAQQRRLPRPIVADEAHPSPLPDQAADIVEDDLLPEGQPKPLDVDQNDPSQFSRTLFF